MCLNCIKVDTFVENFRRAGDCLREILDAFMCSGNAKVLHNTRILSLMQISFDDTRYNCALCTWYLRTSYLTDTLRLMTPRTLAGEEKIFTTTFYFA